MGVDLEIRNNKNYKCISFCISKSRTYDIIPDIRNFINEILKYRMRWT